MSGDSGRAVLTRAGRVEGWRVANGLKVRSGLDPGVADVLRESVQAKWLMVHTGAEGERSGDGGARAMG